MSVFISSRAKKLSLDKCQIMGILNITPDSFSDGGRFTIKRGAKTSSSVRHETIPTGLSTGLRQTQPDKDERYPEPVADRFIYDLDAIIEAARAMIKDGAGILDVGGESTGPESHDISEAEELSRVIPVIQCLVRAIPEITHGDVWISVDTYKPEVARQALSAGADMINDVTAFRYGGIDMARVIATYRVPVVLMYSKDDTPRTTRDPVDYDDVVGYIRSFLQERIVFAQRYGILAEHIVIDPGMGAFVSSKARYSLEILRRLDEFMTLGYPILTGVSRKGFIGEVLGGLPLDERLEGTLASIVVSVMKGARIVRVHNVKEAVRAVRMTEGIIGE